jgi:tripartite-type tricarboxylate transporter receptor subunit TctC
VLQTERSNLLPDVPTIGESIGVDSGNAATWFAIMGPSGLSPEILSRLELAILAIFTPEMHRKLTEAGLDVLALASVPFAARVRQESHVGQSAIKQLGLKIN